MSIYEQVLMKSANAQQTRKIGQSLVNSLYVKPLTIFLNGELGTGKTAFAQGFARGLGIKQMITSPTFSIEHRYNKILLLHIDLYRLDTNGSIKHLAGTDDFPGIQIIEWADASIIASYSHIPRVLIHFSDELKQSRRIVIELLDFRIPTLSQIYSWQKAVKLSENVIRHSNKVAEVSDLCAQSLIRRQVFVRRKALKAAALTHDLMRFVDLIKGSYQCEEQKSAAIWNRLRRRYGITHEYAAQSFLAEQGYPEIGEIVATHGPPRTEDSPVPKTTEQKLLAYSDKRVIIDRVITLDERFDDLNRRYQNGKETAMSLLWRRQMKELEKELFPEGPPF